MLLYCVKFTLCDCARLATFGGLIVVFVFGWLMLLFGMVFAGWRVLTSLVLVGLFCC